jgi:hypothetical protein
LGEVINRMMQQRTSEHRVDIVLFACCSIECANLVVRLRVRESSIWTVFLN